MRNNTKYVLPKILSDDFKNFVNETVDLESTLTSKKSLNYYDVDKFEFNNSKNKIFQIGKKCYILNKNNYVDELSGEINIKKFKDDQPYTLTQFFGKNDNVNISGVWNYYKNIEYLYNRFILERYLYNIRYKKIKIINDKNKMYKNKSHLFKINNIIIKEKEYLKYFFDKKM